jgi:hypothetical protein
MIDKAIDIIYLRHKIKSLGWVPVAHTCNPNYSGDQEDCGLKPAPANSSQNPISKKPITKTGLVAQGKGPDFKPQYLKKKKKLLRTMLNKIKTGHLLPCYIWTVNRL